MKNSHLVYRIVESLVESSAHEHVITLRHESDTGRIAVDQVLSIGHVLAVAIKPFQFYGRSTGRPRFALDRA